MVDAVSRSHGTLSVKNSAISCADDALLPDQHPAIFFFNQTWFIIDSKTTKYALSKGMDLPVYFVVA